MINTNTGYNSTKNNKIITPLCVSVFICRNVIIFSHFQILLNINYDQYVDVIKKEIKF